MARAAGAGPGRRFLDVAAGTGDSSLALARRGAEVVSTDFTQAMLALGPAKFRRRGLERLVWASVGADAQRLPFQSRQLRRRHHLLRDPQRGGPAPGLPGVPAGAQARRAAHHPGVQPAPAGLAAAPVRLLQPAPPAPHRRLDQRRPRGPTPTCPRASAPSRTSRPWRRSWRPQASWRPAWTDLTGGIVALHTARKAAGDIMGT